MMSQKSTAVSEREQSYSFLMAENERLLEALQELDFDFKLGKVPEADYPGQRALLAAQWTEIRKKLDVFEDLDKKPVRPAAQKLALADPAPVESTQPEKPRRISAPDDEIEALIAARRRDRKDVTGGFCAQCGAPIHKTDKFCSRCGATLF